jgi:hypothetical protein
VPAVRFPLGQAVTTPGALDAFGRTDEDPFAFLARHQSGDWGDLNGHDKRQMNDLAVARGDRILSAYTLSDGTRIWVITEADRSSTCILLPEEY